MKRGQISFICFIPLLELLFSNNVRKELNFLKKNREYLVELKRIFEQKKEKRKNFRNLNVFIPKYSKIKWDIYPDGFFYFRRIRTLIYDQEPIRPLIPLKTNTIKWKNKVTYAFFKNFRKTIRIYPILVSETEKCLDITKSESFDIEKVKEVKSEVNKSNSSEKLLILEAFFGNIDDLNIPSSNTLTIIEIDNNYFIEKVSINKRNLFSIEEVNFYFDKKRNSILIIYNNKYPKIFRERTKIAVKVPFILRTLIDRALYLIQRGILSEINIFQKIEFLEFVAQFINPEEYSSLYRQTYFFITGYQRDIFDEIESKINLRERYDFLKETLLKKVVKWESYELAYLKKRNTIPSNTILDELPKIMDDIEEPKLELQEKLLLEFLVEKFVERVTIFDKEPIIIESRIPFGSVTRNEIITNINKWLAEKKLDTNIITESSLKEEHPPKIIKNLYRRGLVKIIDSERTVPKFYFVVNEKHDYIKKLIIEKH